MSNKFTVSFGLSPVLGRGDSKITKMNKLNKSNKLNDIIKVIDDNPVMRVYNKELIKSVLYDHILNSGNWARFMTVTIAPNINEFKADDEMLSSATKEGSAYQKRLWDKVFNTFKKYQCIFIGCLEYHKYRPIKHLHAIYTAKNLNRIRNLKKDIRNIVGKSRSSIRDEIIQSNMEKVYEYITKVDENNINKVSGIPEHLKEYVYWNVKNLHV